jgi:hypothetical protein
MLVAPLFISLLVTTQVPAQTPQTQPANLTSRPASQPAAIDEDAKPTSSVKSYILEHVSCAFAESALRQLLTVDHQPEAILCDSQRSMLFVRATQDSHQRIATVLGTLDADAPPAQAQQHTLSFPIADLDADFIRQLAELILGDDGTLTLEPAADLLFVQSDDMGLLEKIQQLITLVKTHETELRSSWEQTHAERLRLALEKQNSDNEQASSPIYVQVLWLTSDNDSSNGEALDISQRQSNSIETLLGADADRFVVAAAPSILTVTGQTFEMMTQPSSGRTCILTVQGETRFVSSESIDIKAHIRVSEQQPYVVPRKQGYEVIQEKQLCAITSTVRMKTGQSAMVGTAPVDDDTENLFILRCSKPAQPSQAISQ